MKKTILTMLLCGALLCPILPAMAAPAAGEAGSQDAPQILDSVLYYGAVREVFADEDGAVTAIWLDSQRYGGYIMKISPRTVWIDSGNRAAGSPAGLQAGEGIYVFHSSVSTRSLPPQSQAYAVVRNVPQDALCPQYHKVEQVQEADGSIRITTNNGGLIISADEKTAVSAYSGAPAGGLSGLNAGDHIMAWYGAVALSYPGQAYSSCIMLLDSEEQAPLTRAGFAALLHQAEDSPVVNYAMDYEDVDPSAPWAEAVRWMSSEGFMGGYGDGRFGPDDIIQRQQLVSALWRYAGSPILMDYPGLTQYEDVADIDLFAQLAMAWAHQRGLLDTAGTQLAPRGGVTAAETSRMIQALKAPAAPALPLPDGK